MLEKLFQLKSLGTNVRTEVLAGVTTFLTMAYIVIVNPLVLGQAGVPLHVALLATVLVAGLSSILMGLVAKLPIALAPGMGLNAFFTYTLVLGMGLSWQTALGAIFVSGIVFIIVSLPGLGLREAVVKAIPSGIRGGVAAGIGLFLAAIGLINAGVVVGNPATLVSFGGFTSGFVLFLAGLVLAGVLLARRVKGALLISILAVSAVAVVSQLLGHPLAPVTIPDSIFSLPSTEGFLAFDLKGLLSVSLIAPIFALLFTDMFDSISTFVGVSKAANLMDEDGQPKNVGQALLVDAISTTLSGVVGSSSGTAYIESAAGVAEGGRSGLTAVVAGLLFLPFMFLAPLLGLIPSVATAPILVLVGLFMLSAAKDIDWSDYRESVPAFIALVAIPLTYSITQGILLAFITYTLMSLLLKKSVPLLLWIISALSVVLLIVS